jgi:hypothetical protein
MPKRGSCGSVLRCGLPPLEPILTIKSTNRPLVYPACPPKSLRHSRWLLGMQACPPAPTGVALIIESGATRNSHSARCLAGAQLPATSCLGGFWTPAARSARHLIIAGVQHLHTSGNVSAHGHDSSPSSLLPNSVRIAGGHGSMRSYPGRFRHHGTHRPVRQDSTAAWRN